MQTNISSPSLKTFERVTANVLINGFTSSSQILNPTPLIAFSPNPLYSQAVNIGEKLQTLRNKCRNPEVQSLYFL